MQKMDFCLILTATINPGEMPDLVRKDVITRLEDYKKSFKFWVNKSSVKKIVFIDLPPNKFFEVKAINLGDRSVHLKRSYSFRMPCIPTKPMHFELKENNLVFIIYPKGTPWPNKQLKTT